MDVDFVVIGSGFGGSVAALRLAEKGYSVRVLEAGRRFAEDDLPTSTADPRPYLWAPSLGCRGPQRIDLLRHAAVLSGVGVGGGSLVYGNTLYTPGDRFFAHPTVAAMGGREALEPHYAEARRMLGVVPNPMVTPTDELAAQVATELGRGDTVAPSPVGVFFGEPGVTVPDPYFGGRGPDRTGCTGCGACNLGCPVGAKNTLPRTYLHLAEALGAEIVPEARVTRLEPHGDGAEGWTVHIAGMDPVRCGRVVLAAGVLGTLRLLLENQPRLPRLSPTVGHAVRTNSETVLAVRDDDRAADRSRGIAASTSFWWDDRTQIQIDRFAPSADSTAAMMALLVDGGSGLPRPLRWFLEVLRHPIRALRHLDPRGFARQSAVLVVMQDHDSSLIVDRRRRWWAPWTWRLRSRPGPEGAAPTWIPEGNAFARALAAKMGGTALAWVTEIFLDRPVTAHILGGCAVAESAEHGVVDLQQRVHGYEGLWICDGSVVPCNLGANPALTILAMAERAMAQVPRSGSDEGAL